MRRILHISDVHFGPPHRPAVAAELAAWIDRCPPHLVVLSGDLTQRAKPWQFQQARDWVAGLGAPVLVVPGNHDVPLYRIWERCLVPYGAYRRHFARQLEPEFEDDELLVLGVNSAHGWTFKHGRIRRSTLGRLERRLAAASSGQRKVVVVHHPLTPPPSDGSWRAPWGVGALMEMCGRHAVDLVLSGHEHQTYFVDAGSTYPAAAGTLLVAVGTTTSSRGRGVERGANSLVEIQLGEQATVLTHHLRGAEEPCFSAVRSLELRRGAGLSPVGQPGGVAEALAAGVS